MLWQEYTLNFESQELPASYNLDKWENVFYQKPAKARTFPEVVPGSRKWNADLIMQRGRIYHYGSSKVTGLA